MSKYPFTAADLEALRAWDTPTICNALEVVAPHRRNYGFTVRPMVAVDRKLPPIPGTGYSVARWQVDAHAFWRASGDRLLGAAELAAYGPSRLAKVFTELSLTNVYDYELHVGTGEQMLANKALPADYMSLAPGSTDPMVWHDIVRMKTLNGEQSARAVEKHVCLARGSLVLTQRGLSPF